MALFLKTHIIHSKKLIQENVFTLKCILKLKFLEQDIFWSKAFQLNLLTLWVFCFCRLIEGNGQNQALEALLCKVLVSHFSFLFFQFPCCFTALITLYVVQVYRFDSVILIDCCLLCFQAGVRTQDCACVLASMTLCMQD